MKMDICTLNGRDSGLQFVAKRMSTAEQGKVVVAGPAGVAKTRLAQEVLAAPKRSGCVTQWGPGTSAVTGGRDADDNRN